MVKWLRCFFMGHDLKFLNDGSIYLNADDKLPYKRYKLYQCQHCMKSKKVDV